MIPAHLRDLGCDESGLAVLEYALVLAFVIVPVAVIMWAAFRYFVSLEFLEALVDDFVFRFAPGEWIPRHPIGAFTYF